MDDFTVNIPSLAMPLDEGALLLPNTAVAEIVGYREPEPVEGSPEWLLGSFSWRGVTVPLIAFEGAIGRSVPPAEGRLRIAVINTLNGNPNLPFFGIVLHGIPRLLKVNQAVLTADAKADKAQGGVLCEVFVNGEPAMIPDLDALEKLIEKPRKG